MDRFKTLVHIVLIPVIGFVMLNISFLIVALIRMEMRFNFIAQHIVSVGAVLIMSWGLIKVKKMPQIVRASILMVPIAVALVYIGILFYSNQPMVYILSAGIVSATVFILYRLKTPWFYYYSILILSAALIYMNWMGIDI